MIHTETLINGLLGLVGGGTLVPLVYSIYQRRKSKTADDLRAAVEIEEIASRAATEAVVATKGALDILRQQVADGQEVRVALERGRAEDALTIRQLRQELADALRAPPSPA